MRLWPVITVTLALPARGAMAGGRHCYARSATGARRTTLRPTAEVRVYSEPFDAGDETFRACATNTGATITLGSRGLDFATDAITHRHSGQAALAPGRRDPLRRLD